jgi:hypothetical protein
MEEISEAPTVEQNVSECSTVEAANGGKTNDGHLLCPPPFQPFAASVARRCSDRVQHNHVVQRQAPAFRLLCVKAHTITNSDEDTYDYERAISEFRVAWKTAYWPLGPAHGSHAAVAVLAGLVDVHNKGKSYFDPHKWASRASDPPQAEAEESTGDGDDHEGAEEHDATPPPPSNCTIA